MKELYGIIRFDNPREFIQYFDSEYGNSCYNKATANRGEFLSRNEYDEILSTTRANEPIYLYRKDNGADARSLGFCYDFHRYKTEEAIRNAKAMLENANKLLEFFGAKEKNEKV